MNGRLNRKTFVTTLGAAGLGLGLTTARAHARATPTAATDAAWGPGPGDDQLQRRQQFYTDFTAALADQLQPLTQSGRQPGQGSPHGGAMQGGALQGGMQGGGRQGAQGGTQGGAQPSAAEAVDAALRQALMAVLDAWQGADRLSYGQAAAMKTLVATSPAPLAPSGLGPVLFGAAEGAMRPAPAGVAGGMPGGAMPGGAMPGGGMHAGQGGMAPAPEEPGERQRRHH